MNHIFFICIGVVQTSFSDQPIKIYSYDRPVEICTIPSHYYFSDKIAVVRMNNVDYNRHDCCGETLSRFFQEKLKMVNNAR